MKTRMFLLSFVIFTFTVGTSVSAQVKNWTANGQDVHNTSATLAVFTAQGWANWLQTGAPQQGIVPFSGCDAPCTAEISRNGAGYAMLCTKALIAASNDETKFFSQGVLAEKDLVGIWASFVKTLEVAEVDFMGNDIDEMTLTFDQSNGQYDYDWINHKSVNIKKCIISKQGNDIFIFADPLCGQPFSIKTSNMIRKGQAKLVGATTATTPKPKPGPGNTGTGGSDGSVGTGLTFDQLLALAEAMRQPIVVNAGNNNGNNNGGSVTGGRDGANGSDGKDASASNPPNDSWNWVPTPTPDVNFAQLRQWQQQNRDAMTVPLQPAQPNTVACGGCNQGALTRADVALLEQQGQVSNDLALRNLRQQRAQTGLQAAGLALGAGAFVVGQLERFGVIKTPNQGNVNNYYGGTTWTQSTGGPADFANGLWH